MGREHLPSGVLLLRRFPPALSVALAVCCATPRGLAYDAERIGLTAMRRERPAITGTGVRVAQPEAQAGPDAWQVNPFAPGVMQPVSLFTWISAAGTATTYPNSVGVESGHANAVAQNFFGTNLGVAPGVAHVNSYDAEYFYESIVALGTAANHQVVNQSFIFGGIPIAQQATIESEYDSYADTHNVLFVSGVNNANDSPPAPGTAYNTIAVGRSDGGSSIGPNYDGRAKPDIVAPEGTTSTATPLVAGAAALLRQALAANDGGPGTASAGTNASVIKALLLNGAIKSASWTNGPTRPLDARSGAGTVNIYNSDLQLRGGRRLASATNSVGVGAAHPPTGDTNNVASLRGWDGSLIQSTVTSDRVAHYYFLLPTNAAAYSMAATLVWKKHSGALANLDLFLYDTATGAVVTNSVSTVDNVEHLFMPRLSAGRYDLQVLKRGGVGQGGVETYGLAFDFAPVQLSLARAGTNVVIAWPASPAGFVLQSAPSLNAPINWQPVNTPSVLSNAMNTVTLPPAATMQFFRLFRP